MKHQILRRGKNVNNDKKRPKKGNEKIYTLNENEKIGLDNTFWFFK